MEEMKALKFLLTTVFIFTISIANAANVIWDCFDSMEINDPYIGQGTSIYYYNNVTPELAFIYQNNAIGLVTSATATGDYCNLGYPVAYWVLANAGDILISKEDYLSKELLYNNGYPNMPERIDGATITTLPSKTYYFAILGDNYGESDWYAWVEIYADTSGLSVVNSAFSFDTPLIVGGGAVPEPSSGMLLIIGATLLCLKRKAIYQSYRSLTNP
jgi:hypothetical protein